MPGTPCRTTISAMQLTRYCSRARSSLSPSDRGEAAACRDDRANSRTSDLGKKPAEPSMAPPQPTLITGSSCWPSPVKTRNLSASPRAGLRAICVSCETSPCESLQPTMLGCCASVANVAGVTLTMLDTPP
ncbi:hypothetical protein IF2G_09490 [Cordyceps javanica]|nr:hypothetical protein IF2G_09490 [Cordyceps javanica]